MTWDNSFVQEVVLYWSSDPRIHLGLVEVPSGLSYRNIEFVDPTP